MAAVGAKSITGVSWCAALGAKAHVTVVHRGGGWRGWGLAALLPHPGNGRLNLDVCVYIQRRRRDLIKDVGRIATCRIELLQDGRCLSHQSFSLQGMNFRGNLARFVVKIKRLNLIQQHFLLLQQQLLFRQHYWPLLWTQKGTGNEETRQHQQRHTQ